MSKNVKLRIWRLNEVNLLTEKELCDFLSVTRQTLVVLRKQGLPYFLLGSKLIRYDVQEVLEWLRESMKAGDNDKSA